MAGISIIRSNSNVLPYIKDWKNSSTFDTTIICEDGKCRAHRLVLCHASPYMGTLLDDQFPGEESFYSIPDVTKHIMDQMLQFAYTGAVTCKSEKNLKEFKEAMKFLGWLCLDSCDTQEGSSSSSSSSLSGNSDVTLSSTDSDNPDRTRAEKSPVRSKNLPLGKQRSKSKSHDRQSSSSSDSDKNEPFDDRTSYTIGASSENYRQTSALSKNKVCEDSPKTEAVAVGKVVRPIRKKKKEEDEITFSADTQAQSQNRAKNANEMDTQVIEPSSPGDSNATDLLKDSSGTKFFETETKTNAQSKSSEIDISLPGKRKLPIKRKLLSNQTNDFAEDANKKDDTTEKNNSKILETMAQPETPRLVVSGDSLAEPEFPSDQGSTRGSRNKDPSSLEGGLDDKAGEAEVHKLESKRSARLKSKSPTKLAKLAKDKESISEKSKRRSPSVTAIERRVELKVGDKSTAALGASAGKRQSVRFKEDAGSESNLKSKSTSPEGQITAVATGDEIEGRHSGLTENISDQQDQGGRNMANSTTPDKILQAKSSRFSLSRTKIRSNSTSRTIIDSSFDDEEPQREKSQKKVPNPVSDPVSAPNNDRDDLNDEPSTPGRNRRKTRNLQPVYSVPPTRKKSKGQVLQDEEHNGDEGEQKHNAVEPTGNKSIGENAGKQPQLVPSVDPGVLNSPSKAKVPRRLLLTDDDNDLEEIRAEKAGLTKNIAPTDKLVGDDTLSAKTKVPSRSLSGSPQKQPKLDSPANRKSPRKNMDEIKSDDNDKSPNNGTELDNNGKRRRKNNEELSPIIPSKPGWESSARTISDQDIVTVDHPHENLSSSPLTVTVGWSNSSGKDCNGERALHGSPFSHSLRNRPVRISTTDWTKITTCCICKGSSPSPSLTLKCLLKHGHSRCWICLNEVPLNYLRRHRLTCTQYQVEGGKIKYKNNVSVESKASKGVVSSPNIVACKWCRDQGEKTWFLQHIDYHNPIEIP